MYRRPRQPRRIHNMHRLFILLGWLFFSIRAGGAGHTSSRHQPRGKKKPIKSLSFQRTLKFFKSLTNVEKRILRSNWQRILGVGGSNVPIPQSAELSVDPVAVASFLEQSRPPAKISTRVPPGLVCCFGYWPCAARSDSAVSSSSKEERAELSTNIEERVFLGEISKVAHFFAHDSLPQKVARCFARLLYC